jgi:hypothetical protein
LDAALKGRSSTCQLLRVSFRRNALDATLKTLFRLSARRMSA